MRAPTFWTLSAGSLVLLAGLQGAAMWVMARTAAPTEVAAEVATAPPAAAELPVPAVLPSAEPAPQAPPLPPVAEPPTRVEAAPLPVAAPLAVPAPTPEPAAAALRGPDWVKARPAERYTVQVLAGPDLDKMRSLLARLPPELPVAYLENAAARTSRYVLVAGDFDSFAAAEAAAAAIGEKLGHKSWARRFGVVRGEGGEGGQ